MKSTILFLLISFSACQTNTVEQTQTHSKTSAVKNPGAKNNISLKQDWIYSDGLESVESVVYDKENQVLYASNGKDYKPGKDGFISKISIEGKLLELNWVSGLNRPTGMAIHKGKLYVGDVNSLLIIDTKQGRILQRIKEPIENSGLNDVSINQKGEVFVTASFVHSVFKLEEDKLERWLQDEEKLKWANGIVAGEEQITVGGLDLFSIDISSKKITQIDLNPFVQDFDGIAKNEANEYFLTTVDNSALWFMDDKAQVTKLIKDDAYFSDLSYVPSLSKIFVARGNKEVGQYFISSYLVEN